MKRETFADFRERLLYERSQVAMHFRQHSCQPHEDELEMRDGVDEAERFMELSTQGRLAESEIHLLEKIDLALRRIDDGTYGNCLACGDEIPRERLAAKPSVALCVSCQKEKEQRVTPECEFSAGGYVYADDQRQ